MKFLRNHWKLVVFLLLDMSIFLHGEICLSDENCQIGEFCGEAHEGGGDKICRPCFQCFSALRQKSSRLINCARSQHDCGNCLPGSAVSFTNEGFLLCMPQSSNDEETNSTEWLNRDAEVASDYYNDEEAKAIGTILGGVALGIVAVIVMAIVIFYGVKYIRKKENKEDRKEPVELQELQPKPIPVETTIPLEDVNTAQPEVQDNTQAV